MDRINNNEASDRALQTQGADETLNAEQPGPNTPDEVVSLTSAAREAERIRAMVEQSNGGRLAQVRDAIANGTYSVSGEAIARKLIELHKR